MLNRRVHILFDQKTFDFLEKKAKNEDVSVAALIREAVKETYLRVPDAELLRRKKVAQDIAEWQAYIGKQKNINYKELIKYGRKY